ASTVRGQAQKVKVVLADGSDITPNGVKAALAANITAIHDIAKAGKGIEHRGWEWGKSLYYYDLVVLLKKMDGIERVGRIWVQHSEDEGATWSAPALLSELKAGADGADNADYGLLHWGEDPAHSCELILV